MWYWLLRNVDMNIIQDGVQFDKWKELISNESVFCIGDSHVNFFGGNEELNFQKIGLEGINFCGAQVRPFIPLHLGPVLAYNAAKMGGVNHCMEKVIFLMDNVFYNGAQVLCSFGEIDIRVHVWNRVYDRDFKSVIDDIIDHYLCLISVLKKKYRLIIWGPVASQKDEWFNNPNYPRSGTERERNIATHYFNTRLESICKSMNITFISIFSELIDEKYCTKEYYISDECHLSQRAWSIAAPKFRDKGIRVDCYEEY